ncbi:sodium-coupled neutral amino acid transporter [Pycnococcus provasolii]
MDNNTNNDRDVELASPGVLEFDSNFDAASSSSGGGDLGSAKVSSSSQGGEKLATGGGATEQQASMNLSNAIIGAGVLSLPSCYASCGIVLATALVLTVSFLSTLSLQYLLQNAHAVGATRYHDLAKTVLGSRAKVVVELCTFTLQLGALVAYVNILADVISPIANSVLPPGAEPSRTFVMCCVVMCGMLPVSLVTARNVNILAYVSSLTIGIIAVFVSVVIDVAAVKMPKLGVGDIVLFDVDGLFSSLPIVCFALTAHTALFVVMGTLVSSSVEVKQRVSVRAMCVVTFIYILVGSCGYLAFRDRTAGNVLRNFDGAFLGPVLSRVVRLGFGVTIIGTVPMVVQPLTSFLISNFENSLALSANDTKSSNFKANMHYVMTIAPFLMALLLAIYVPNVKTAFGLTGATASMIMSYILPGMIFLKTRERSSGGKATVSKLHGSSEELVADEVEAAADTSIFVSNSAKRAAAELGMADSVLMSAVIRFFASLCSTKNQRRNSNVSRFLIVGGCIFATVSTWSTVQDMLDEHKTVAVARTVANFHKVQAEANASIAEVSNAMESLDIAQENFVRVGGSTWVKDATEDLKRASGAAQRAKDFAESAASHHHKHSHNLTHHHSDSSESAERGEDDGDSDGDEKSSITTTAAAAPRDLLEKLSSAANVTSSSLAAMEDAMQQFLAANASTTVGTALNKDAHVVNVTAVRAAANSLYQAELQAQDAVQMLDDTQDYLRDEKRVDSRVYVRLVEESSFAVKAALKSLKDVGLGIDNVKDAAGDVSVAKLRARDAVKAVNKTAVVEEDDEGAVAEKPKEEPKEVKKEEEETDSKEERNAEEDTKGEKAEDETSGENKPTKDVEPKKQGDAEIDEVEKASGKLDSAKLIETANATVAHLEAKRQKAQQAAEAALDATHSKSRKRVSEIAELLSTHT